MVKIEMHCHSAPASSCSKVACSLIAQAHKDGGYDGIVLTNHYTCASVLQNGADSVYQVLQRDYETVKECGEKVGLKVFFGAELRFNTGLEDFLLFGLTLKEFYEIRQCCTLDLMGFAKIKPATAILVQAHPFRAGQTAADYRFIDGIEIHNGVVRHNSSNHLAFAYAKAHNLIMTSGSDYHQFPDLGMGGMQFDEMPHDEHMLSMMLSARKGICLGSIYSPDPYSPRFPTV